MLKFFIGVIEFLHVTAISNTDLTHKSFFPLTAAKIYRKKCVFTSDRNDIRKIYKWYKYCRMQFAPF